MSCFKNPISMQLSKLCCVILIFIAVSCYLFSTNVLALSLSDQLKKYFLTHENKGFNGSVLIVQNNKVLLDEGFGIANDKTGEKIKKNTVFDIGSITKQFTAAAIMKLTENGKLNIEDEISKYFVNLPKDKSDITIHQLLTHTSGLTEHSKSDLEQLSKEDALKRIFASKLTFKPGDGYYYSNSGYTVLAAIIEKVSNLHYTKYLQKEIFTPFGMEDTGFYGDIKYKTKKVANGYFNGNDSGNPSSFKEIQWGPMGNGEILSNTKDMYKWFMALTNGEFISKENVKRLFTKYVQEDSDSYYGYGWSIKDTKYGTLITHNGGGLGGNSDIGFYKEKNVLIIISSNRITYKMIFDVIPFEFQFPATEARAQVMDNIFTGDFTKIPSVSWPALYSVLILISVAVILIAVILLVRYIIKRFRRKSLK